jgi:hypothetical protein
MQRGVELLRAKMAPADPLLLGALIQYRGWLQAVHRKPEARRIDEEVAKEVGQWPCVNCTVSAYGLANGFRQAGR